MIQAVHSAGKEDNADQLLNRNVDTFKSHSTIAFNDENNRQKLDTNWDRPGLLKFPNIIPQLKKERKIQRELYKEIILKLESRHVNDTEQKLKRYDVEINLQRMLYKNDKYIGLCRNKRKNPSMFNNGMMHRIKNNQNLNLNDIGNFDDPITNSCRRFEQYSKRYEERYLKEIFEPNIKTHRKLPKIGNDVKSEDDDDVDDRKNYDNKPINNNSQHNKQFISLSVNDFRLPVAQQRTSTMIDVNLKGSDKKLNIESSITSLTNASIPVLKPKKQVVNSSFKKKPVLPAINNNNSRQGNNNNNNNNKKVLELSDEDIDDDFEDMLGDD